jgi:hypothetical protein
MIKKISSLTLGLLFALFVAAPTLAVIQPAPTASAACGDTRLLGIPAWYRGLTKEINVNGEKECVIISPTEASGGDTQAQLTNYITKLVLNVIEMATVIAGYIAAFFILYGGFTFITLGSTSQGVEKARHTILNAVIGLAIALGAIAIINLIFGVLG